MCGFVCGNLYYGPAACDDACPETDCRQNLKQLSPQLKPSVRTFKSSVITPSVDQWWLTVKYLRVIKLLHHKTQKNTIDHWRRQLWGTGARAPPSTSS